jgi:hypothetical protein
MLRKDLLRASACFNLARGVRILVCTQSKVVACVGVCARARIYGLMNAKSMLCLNMHACNFTQDPRFTVRACDNILSMHICQLSLHTRAQKISAKIFVSLKGVHVTARRVHTHTHARARAKFTLKIHIMRYHRDGFCVCLCFSSCVCTLPIQTAHVSAYVCIHKTTPAVGIHAQAV